MFGSLSMAAIASASALTNVGLTAINDLSHYEGEPIPQNQVVQRIEEYTPQVSNEAKDFIDNFINSLDYREITYDYSTVMPMSSSGKPQATWKKDIDGSNVLKGIPKYDSKKGQYMLQYIRPGDIIYQPNSEKNHTLLVENICVYYYYEDDGCKTGIYIRVIEATTIDAPGHTLGKVIRSVFDEDSFYSGCKIYRVYNATTEQIGGAIDFAIGQLGKGYGFSYDYDEDNWWWYCSKLCAAAYMSQGIKFAIAEDHPWKYLPDQLIKEDCLYQITLPNC